MFRWFLPTLFAVIVGLLVLLGSLLPIPTLASLRADLLSGAAVIASFAMVLAFANVLRVHFGRLVAKQAKSVHATGQRFASLILLLSAIASFVLVLLQGPEGIASQTIVEGVLIPGQSALLALTAVTLVLTGARILRTRWRASSVLFLVVALLVLWTTVGIGTPSGIGMPSGIGTPALVYPGILETVMRFVNAVATGGMRGLLLGVALGTVITGLRIIVGIDRPHSGG
ncbi:MAG: hypothetical protein MUF84_06055 [Anaerolineae bacterium]|jgi:hypothetical protein|nr:hypothetical protein [Anaerolineae bacterium]